MTVVVTNNNESLEACTLSGTGLLLNWHNLHDLIFQGWAQEGLHYLVLLNWHGEQVDLLHGLDLTLQETTPNDIGCSHAMGCIS